MSRIAADCSPLILYGRAGRIALLRAVCGDILVPETVAMECTRDMSKPGARELLQAFQKGHLIRLPDVAIPNRIDLNPALDRGEKAAIALAIQQDIPLLIDERRGRKAAASEHLHCIGSLGVLIAAKKQGQITSISPIIGQWRDQFGYFISQELMQQALRLAGEDLPGEPPLLP
jgi:predicted nucleic acid-binding protein